MKLLKITFTTPRHVLGETVGLLSTEPNQASRQVDSITADGFWVVVVRGERTAVVPCTSIEEGVPLTAAPVAKSSGSKPR
jgi:hypothetical protein